MKIYTNTTIAFISLVSATVFAQDTAILSSKITEQPKLSYLDSIKRTFVHHEIASCVDNRMMKEMVNQDLFKEMTSDIETINLDRSKK